MDPNSLRLITHRFFFSAVQSGDFEFLKTYIHKLTAQDASDHITVSELLALQNEAGETALYIAAEKNFQEIFSYLLGFCDLQIAMIRTRADLSAFHVAAKCGHIGIVKELLDTWPEICKSCDSTNTSPLYSAAVQDHLEVVNLILDTDVESARIVRKNGKTSLHTAARYGLVGIVKALISRDEGIVCIKDKKGQTALHMAVKGNNPLVVEEMLLVDHSVLNQRDKKGNTPLHIATRKNRVLIVQLLLSYTSLDINAINFQQQTPMDLASNLPYGESSLEITKSLIEAGAKRATSITKPDNESMELKRNVSDIRHEVYSQFLQNQKTHNRVSGIAKELAKIHREAVQNTVNSVTVVAILFASIAFVAIFNLPGLYYPNGRAKISKTMGFKVFCLLNAASLFASLSVVVVQITLVAWDTRAQKFIVPIINKMMWGACMTTSGAFLSVGFVVAGRGEEWMTMTVTLLGAPMLIGTLVSMCYFRFRKWFAMGGNDSQRRIRRRRSGSKSSMSWSVHSDNIAGLFDEDESDLEKIYAL